jgi:hypothetical protein
MAPALHRGHLLSVTVFLIQLYVVIAVVKRAPHMSALESLLTLHFLHGSENLVQKTDIEL